ncbi:zonular occludens toxin domain-containing protein [Lysobacter sp. FW306-1B-D06B]|uniref:zonular occludens toxin domain-containing protein n=1 Tax=Lysobacter sp. FW306-1B-D06B TaxID=3140250 RepID=UPI0031407380
MLKLVTGQPGHGKTAYAIDCALKLKAEGRVVYAHGIKDLDYDKIGFQRIEDPTKWQDLPDGSVLILDECYTTFPNRNPGAKVPDHVEAMARHRHRGFDFILIAQQGLQLDPFLRGLYEEHVHVRKKLGKVTKLLRWSQYQTNVKAQCADAANWVRPAHVFQYYTSTVLDTAKMHIPMWAKLLALSAVVLVAVLWYFSHRWKSKIDAYTAAETPIAETAGFAPRGVSHRGAGPANEGPRWETRTDYATDHLPRFATMPWTARVFDQRQVVSDPQLICMSSMPGRDVDGREREASCTCLTEQGTLYEMSQPECRRIARFGPVYNPYRTQQAVAQQPPSGGVGGSPPTAMAAIDAAPTGAILSSTQVTGYGDIGARRIESAPR